MAKIGWGRILAGVATAAAAGAAYAYYRQRAAKAPIYSVISTDGVFETRRYPALRVISTIQAGSRDRALGNGFGLLADYMFGEGREGEEMPIAMPVLATALSDGNWRISFLLPEAKAGQALEPPGRGIWVEELPARDVAVITVPGKPTDRLFASKAAELGRWIEGRGGQPGGDIVHAYHNSPLRPGTANPNEIWTPLVG